MAIQVLENYVYSYTGVPYCQQNASGLMINVKWCMAGGLK